MVGEEGFVGASFLRGEEGGFQSEVLRCWLGWGRRWGVVDRHAFEEVVEGWGVGEAREGD